MLFTQLPTRDLQTASLFEKSHLEMGQKKIQEQDKSEIRDEKMVMKDWKKMLTLEFIECGRAFPEGTMEGFRI